MVRWLGFYSTPTYGASTDGFLHGTEEDDVHELAVIETLEEDGDEEGPILVAFKGEGNGASKNIDQQEAQEENHGTLNVGGSPKVGNLADVQLRQAPEEQAAEEEQINDGGDKGECDLKDHDVGQSDPAKGAMLETK